MYNIIVNPNAGKGLASTNIKKVSKCLKKLKLPYLVYFSEKEKDIDDYAIELYNAGEQDFIVVGGDGTINRFINAIPDISKINIGIIPSGTNNNFAKTINIPENPVDALQLVISNKTQNFDAFKINDVLACNCLSFGFIENVKHMIARVGKKSKPNFVDYLKNLKKYEPISIDYSAKDIQEKDVLIHELIVANGMFNGKMKASPLSNIQDGLLNLICVVPKEKVSKAKDLMKIKSGKHIYDERNKMYWTEEITISSITTPIKVMLDGELKEFESLKIKAVPNLLNIYYHE